MHCLNLVSHSIANLSMVSYVVANLRQSSGEQIVANSSSVYSFILPDIILLAKWLIKQRNEIGARTFPWGTLDNISVRLLSVGH